MTVEVKCWLLVGDRLVVVCVWVYKSKDQEGPEGCDVCGAVKFGRVKMARVEVKLLFGLIGVWGVEVRLHACVGNGWVLII